MRWKMGESTMRNIREWVFDDSTRREPVRAPDMVPEEIEIVTGPIRLLRQQIVNTVEKAQSLEDFAHGLGALMAEPTFVTFPGEEDNPIHNEDVNLVMWQYPQIGEVDAAVQRWTLQKGRGLAAEAKPAFYSLKNLLRDIVDLKMKIDEVKNGDRRLVAQRFLSDRLRLPIATGIADSDVFFRSLQRTILEKYF